MTLNIVTIAAYALMVVVNALANILPINGMTTGVVSDAYPNLFAPAGVTFSIWGIIYLLLGVYTVYQGTVKKARAKVVGRVNRWFAFSSLVNAVWIFAWHYRVIWLTLLFMGALLWSLIRIADILRTSSLTTTEKLVIKVPFGVYFGWITVATIANATVFLVSLGWDGYPLLPEVWMVIALLTGTAISIRRMVLDQNIAYGLVPVWAYAGIWLKHTSATGFAGAYPTVISTTLACIVLLIAANGYLLSSKKAL